MNAGDPSTRRRGMSFHDETVEPDEIETESAEGMPIRASRRRAARQARTASDAAAASMDTPGNIDAGDRFVRFASETDSRQLSPMSR